MNQKVFIQKSDELLNNMSMEELRNCLHNIARTTPESKRETFIQTLEDFCKPQDHPKNSKKRFPRKRLLTDEKVKDKLNEIKKVFAKIEKEELCLSAQGYEDYSNGYWSSEWIWEYEDNEGVGRILEDAVLFAHDCMNDFRYEEALKVFKLVMDAGNVCERRKWR